MKSHLKNLQKNCGLYRLLQNKERLKFLMKSYIFYSYNLRKIFTLQAINHVGDKKKYKVWLLFFFNLYY